MSRRLRGLRPCLRRALVDLVIGRLRDVQQALAVRWSAHHVSEAALDPIESGGPLTRPIAQRGLRRIRACIIDGEALAGRALVHAERRGAERAWQQSSADQLQSALLQIGYPQLVIEALREPLHQMRTLGAG